MKSEKDASGPWRDRAIIAVAVLVTVAPLLAYAWMAVGVARDLRLQHALERNRTTAQLTARLLEAHWENAHAHHAARDAASFGKTPPRPQDFADWLDDLSVGGGTVIIVADTATGRVLYATGALPGRAESLWNHPALRNARSGPAGAMISSFPDEREEAMVAYAFLDRQGWVVLVSQPVQAALGPTNYLIGRLSIVAAPVLAFLIAAAWALTSLYRRQRSMSLQLAAQNERLRLADRARSDFLANVSHDLRTPLASMKVSLSGLLDPEMTWEPAQAREYIRLAHEELDQLAARVRNLLDMARIEAAPMALQRTVCDLTDITGSALERLGPVLRGHRIEAEFPPEPLLVECDQAQIESVTLNLLENAAKYSPPGSLIYLSGEMSDRRVMLHVRDEGPGVSPADEERIFEKFFRAPAVRSLTGGTGLGLAICKAIVEAHGGEIGVRRPPGGGAEFWFSLPTPPFW